MLACLHICLTAHIINHLIIIFISWPEKPKNVCRYCLILRFQSSHQDLSSSRRYILLASGFELGGSQEKCFQMQLLADLVSGHLGDVGQLNASANICHVIIAGNSLSEATKDKDTLSKVCISLFCQFVCLSPLFSPYVSLYLYLISTNSVSCWFVCII